MHVGISRSFENDVFIVEIGAGCFLVDLKNQTVMQYDVVTIHNMVRNLTPKSYGYDAKLDEIEYLMFQKGFLKGYTKPTPIIKNNTSAKAIKKPRKIYVSNNFHEKETEAEIELLTAQHNINYEKFLGEEILITSSRSKREGAKFLKLVEIIAPDYIDEYEINYKFECDNKFVRLTKGEIYQFIPKKWLDDENHEYYYVIFRYGKTERSKEHIYMSNDYSIKVGDKVLPFGNEKAGNVIKTCFYKKSNAPYPIEKTWLISCKVYKEIDALKYNDFNKYVEEDNYYFKFLKKQEEHKRYIANSLDTYEIFSWKYMSHIEKFMRPNDKGKLNGENILDFLEEEFEGGYYYNGYQGKFLNRYNQLYSFFDSVWMSYLLAKNDYVEDGIIDVYKYMLCIYNNGGFDKYLLDIDFDKKCLNKHITFINNYIGFNI